MVAQYPDSLERVIHQAITRQLASTHHAFTLQDAALLAQFASEAADDAQVPVVFSLVDASGQKRYFFSMDNALLISHSLAEQKAWTAVALKMSTEELAGQILPGAALYGLHSHPGLCCFGGGVPCWSEGRLLGAIGISGGTVAEDIAIAQATIARFSRERFLLTPTQYPQ